MRFRNVFLFLLIMLIANNVFALQQGGVQYSVPIDYSLINEQELNKEAEGLFQKYMDCEDEAHKKILLNKLLSDYSILGEIDEKQPLYFTRLGIVFDKLSLDRYAKSNFFRSANLDDSNPYTFYNFGNYYYDRKQYRRALKVYQKAYDNGYSKDYNTLLKIGKIYEKLGDFDKAIDYYKKAVSIKSTPEVQQTITELENRLRGNNLYSQSLEKRIK